MSNNATTSTVAVRSVSLTFDAEILGTIIRVFAGIAHLGTLAAAIYGFKLSTGYFGNIGSNSQPVVSYERMAYFTGFLALVFTIKSILGILSEIRGRRLVTSVLRPFGFLHRHRGRGFFMIYFGLLFLFCPWDERRKYISFIPGGGQILGGIALLLFRQFCPVFAFVSDGKIVLSSASKKTSEIDPRSIKWGESMNDELDEEAGGSSASVSQTGVAHTSASPLYPSENVTRNPFLGQ